MNQCRLFEFCHILIIQTLHELVSVPCEGEGEV